MAQSEGDGSVGPTHVGALRCARLGSDRTPYSTYIAYASEAEAVASSWLKGSLRATLQYGRLQNR